MSNPASREFRLIVVGASAGGVEALMRLVRGLPADLSAAVCIVLHLSRDSPSMLPELLSGAGPLPATHAVDGEPIHPGRIYIAPPDFHLLVASRRVQLSRGPRENNVRPAVDVLFRSAAVAQGPAVIGVVLTGNLYDGAAGLGAIKRCGGTTVVQDPQDALFPSMPRSALRVIDVDHCVPLSGMSKALVHLAAQPILGPLPDPNADPAPKPHPGPYPDPNPDPYPNPVPDPGLDPDPPGPPDPAPPPHPDPYPVPAPGPEPEPTPGPIVSYPLVSGMDAAEVKIAEGGPDSHALLREIAVPSSFTCPECHGALWEVRDADLDRFRCRVGHAFTLDALLAQQDNEVEGALWSALRALEERAQLNGRMADRVGKQRLTDLRDRFHDRQRESEQHARVLRQLLQRGVEKEGTE